MKPIVLLDCDGVFADFTGAILDHVFDLTGMRLAHSDVVTWDIFDGPAFAEVRHLKNKAFDHVKNRCHALAMHAGSREAVDALRDLAEVRIVTSPMRSTTWTSDREDWLESRLGIAPKHVIHAHDKQLVYGDFFVDDKPSHIAAWSARWPSGRAIQWAQPHNGNVGVSNWDEVIAEVRAWRP